MPKFGQKSKHHMSSMHSSSSHKSPSPSPSASGGGRSLSMHHPRRSLGGRGREWASECHKLLEAMLELDDSKPFRGPVDPLKYPVYYDITKRSLDLSQILLSLHRGTYSSLCVFASDMRLMFENYKSFFCDANSEVYAMVHRLSYWFESEVARIGNRRMMKTPHGSVIPGVEDPVASKRPRPGTLEARIQALHEDNERTLATSPFRIGSMTSILSPDLLMAAASPASTKNPTPNKDSDVPSLSSKNNSSSADSREELPPPSSTSSFSHKRTESPSEPPNTHWKKKLSHVSTSPPQHEFTQKINATNLWFGTFRCRPKPPVLFSDNSIVINLQLEGKNATITIKAQELVRVCAHFGKGARHTLFLFVLPSVQKRLVSISSKFTLLSCGQIAMFMSDLAPTQISRMVHIFFRMARLSMFGQIFSEIDQQATLNLLANIKPNIMQKVPKKYRSSDSESVRSKESARPSSSASYSDRDISELKEIMLNLTHTLTQKGVTDSPSSPTRRTEVAPTSDKTELSLEQPMDLSSAKPSSSTSMFSLAADDSDDDLEVIIPSDDSDHEPSIPVSPKEGEDLVMMSEVISIKCPITQQTMKHPLRNRHCSHCYDREGIKELIKHRGDKARCPVAGCSNQISLSMADMNHAFDVWLQIQQSTKDGSK